MEMRVMHYVIASARRPLIGNGYFSMKPLHMMFWPDFYNRLGGDNRETSRWAAAKLSRP